MLDKFDKLFSKIISEQIYIDYSTERTAGKDSKNPQPVFKFFNRFGESTYIIDTLGKKSFPISYKNLDAEKFKEYQKKAEDDPGMEKYVNTILMTIESYINTTFKWIIDWKQVAKPRNEILKDNPGRVNYIVDAEFDYYAWAMVKPDGQIIAHGLKSKNSLDPDEDYHIFEPCSIIGIQKSCPGYSSTKNNTGNNSGKSKYEFHFIVGNTETYVLDFNPTGEYSLAHRDKWDVIDTTKPKDLKNLKVNASLKKYLNDAVYSAIDDLIEKSNGLPQASEDLEWPLYELDGDFSFNEWKLYKDGKPFLKGDRQGRFIKFDNENV